MTAISEIDTLIVDLPTIRPHVLAMATMHSQAIVLVRIRDADGVEGLGEGTTIGGMSYCEESPETIKLAIDQYIAPIIKACGSVSVQQAMRTVNLSVAGCHIAKCAVETALLDIAGKRLGVPVSELIGGGRVRDRLAVAWTLASGETGRDIEEAERVLDLRRHNIFKLKIGKRSVRDDVAHVAAIRRAVGDRASVRVDVNQHWDEAQTDLGMKLLEDVGCDLVEQPVAKGNLAAMVRLSAKHVIPLMADEALHGPADAFAIAAAGGARVFAVKIAQSGGLMPAYHVAAIAEAAGVGLYGGTMLEAGVGTAASAHLCASMPSLAWGTELFGSLLVKEDILAEPLRYSDFQLEVPKGPGLGIALDEDRVAFYRRDRVTPRLHAVAEGV
ncbi:muconate cycloisomerase [Sphingobium sp. AR-3-1]|uniref:Muconate cycloisomerase n=1 Tax=Sphingobium psychrophilum TaxID=2728834 RepID=A0A7X9WY09_9SPHN|nr:muconate/chloromuconate family cycloisomerase [Sphingobium psychrophilum]NML11988.1 muconate cycloisomerase [Sphingobium psychrophilum]